MSIEGALVSLEGLATGDAFGELFFCEDAESLIQQRRIPTKEVWRWTDDTHMAITVVECLRRFGAIEQDWLAREFAERLCHDGVLGYGPGTRRLLELIVEGNPWNVACKMVFPGGSFGSGAAMRVAPLGAFYAGDFETTRKEAVKSAEVTHAHTEGIAGAVAVALAASFAAANKACDEAVFDVVLSFTPESQTRKRIELAKNVKSEKTCAREVAQLLGSGQQGSALDTVPFCLWCVSRSQGDFSEAMWLTLAGLGDRDTTCAIVGGIVAASGALVPEEWIRKRAKISEPHTPNFFDECP